MKSAARIATYVLTLALGIAVGFYVGSRAHDVIQVGGEMLESEYFGTHLEMQLDHGTDAAREDTIRAFIALNEKRMAHPNRVLTERLLATDAALSYARLAALANKRGATQEAEQHTKQAVSYCPKIGWKACSIEEINYIVERLDKRGIFGLRKNEMKDAK